MPPKKSTTAAKKDPEHPSYKDMITNAISTVCFLSYYSRQPSQTLFLIPSIS